MAVARAVEHRKAVKQSGFTLIELLIASTILFATLAIVSEGYRASVEASSRASNVAALLTPLPLIQNAVQAEIRAEPSERVAGEGEIMGVSFSFEARSLRFAAPTPVFDPDIADMSYFAPRYRLYEVTLALTRGRTRQQFSYQELAWLPELRPAVSR